MRLGALVTVMLACFAPPPPSSAAPPDSLAPRRIAELPATVVAPAGALTLFADHDHASGSRVDLYLVNRTAAAISVPAQDDDVYAKLEIERDGRWQRAQPHVYSWCGNSYRAIALAPGEFLAWPGHHPSRGMHARVRYALHDGLAIASNAAAGWFDAAELAAARADAMAMKRGDAATVRVGLFAASGGDRDAIYRAALGRLRELPAADAVVLVEELLAKAALADRDREGALTELHRIAPARYDAWLARLIRAPASAARDHLVRTLPWLPDITDPALRGELFAAARDPKRPDLEPLLDAIARYRAPQVEALLAAIADDDRYAASARVRARYLRDEWYGDPVLDVRASPIGTFSDGHPAPVVIELELVNTSRAPIKFAYSSPAELVALYVSHDSGRERTFAVPRKGARWFAPAAATPTTHVEIRPGTSYKLRVAAMDSYDIAVGEHATVWASVRLPGLHRIAQLGGGTGIRRR